MPATGIPNQAPLIRAIEVMREQRTSHLIVTDIDSGEPTGMISALDIAGIVGWGEGGRGSAAEMLTGREPVRGGRRARRVDRTRHRTARLSGTRAEEVTDSVTHTFAGAGATDELFEGRGLPGVRALRRPTLTSLPLLATRVACMVPKLLLDPQQLVVLGQPLAARGSAGLDLTDAGATGGRR